MDFLELKKGIIDCRHCKDKFGFNPNPIFWGHKNAKIMHISQAPSQNVHNTNKPFNDLSGKRLREWYGVSKDQFYNQDLFYITAIAHCFPGKAKNGGDIKPPIECAKEWLLKEISIINNDIYLIVGREAASFLFQKKDYMDLIFNNQKLNNKNAFILPHPSPANAKWFKDNPQFLERRVLEIRKSVQKLVT